MKNSLLTSGILAALLSSLCCITPLLALLAGVSGIASTFSWLDPARPFFVGVTFLVLGFAWYQKLRPRTAEEIACACEEDLKPSFWHSKRFLGIITVFAGLMLSFPSYAHIFYSNGGKHGASAFIEQDTTKFHKIVLKVKGMTCAGCESHIEHEVSTLDGVKSVDAIYAEGSANIEYLPSKLEEQTIIDVINKTGYTVIEKPKD